MSNNNGDMPVITESTDYCPARTTPSLSGRSVIAQPNQSADWNTNKQLLLGFSLFSGVIATAFSLIGAWMILPFAGLEITALGGALYIVCRQLNQRHILYFADDLLIIEKGTRFPQRAWQLPRQYTFIGVERQTHPWDPLRLTLYCHRQGHCEAISIGEFLNREDSHHLLAALRRQGLTVRNDSGIIETEF